MVYSKVISKAFNDILCVASSFNSLSEEIKLNEADYKNLTKREKSVIHLIAQGASNNKIADKLNISDHTVKTHLYSAFKKLTHVIELNWPIGRKDIFQYYYLLRANRYLFGHINDVVAICKSRLSCLFSP